MISHVTILSVLSVECRTVNASECGVEYPLRRSGSDHDDRDHKEAMVLSEGHIQRGLTVIAFSAVAADTVA